MLAAKYRENNMSVSAGSLEAAFAEVLPAKNEQAKVYVDPDVYLARYEYRVQKSRHDTKEANWASAYLTAAEGAKDDLEAALKLGPDNIAVLLTAANVAKNLCKAEVANVRDGSPTEQAKAQDKASSLYSQAIDYYERVIKVAPDDWRAYRDLGDLFNSRGDVKAAMTTWERGLKSVPNDGRRIKLELLLVDALFQQERYSDAENRLKSVNELFAAIDPQSRLEPQRQVDLRSGNLAFQRGHYDEAISLVTDLASGKVLVQGEESSAKPHDRFIAWLILGQSKADLAREAASPAAAQQLWDSALNAFEQAALYEPSDVRPHLFAAGACIAAADACAADADACAAAGRRDDAARRRDDAARRRNTAVTNYQHALEVVGAIKPPREGLQLDIYKALIRLLDEQKRTAEKELYVGRRRDLLAKTARLTLMGVNESIRDGDSRAAVKLAENGIAHHPEDPVNYIALGLRQQAGKKNEDAANAYDKAFQIMEKSPADQTQLATSLLVTGNPGDAAEGEKALRKLAPQFEPACLALVMYLARPEKADEALAVARSDVQSHPQVPAAHVAMGFAWAAKKDDADAKAQAEAEFQKAVSLAPDDQSPRKALLDFYVNTGQAELAIETLNKMLAAAKTPSAEIELIRGDILARVGKRKDAKAAYQKAVELAKDNPAVARRLAEFLMTSTDAGDDVEAEKLLRQIERQDDPARRRLAQVLMSRGGEAEWEEAQKLLEQSAGDPVSFVDRFAEARMLARRGGGQNLEKAAAICQELITEANKRGRPLPGVNLMLAKVRELQGNMDEARKQYLALVDPKDPPPAILATYIAFLLRRGPADEAGRRTEQFLKISPNDLNALDLRAQWLRSQKRAGEIEPLVEDRMQKVLASLDKNSTAQEANLARAAGDLFQRLKLYAAAERWYRRLQKPGGEIYGPLAISIAKQGRIQEAVTLCKEAAKTDDSARPAITIGEIIATGRATPDDLKEAKAEEPYLKKAMEKHADQPALRDCLASIYVLLDQPEQAIEQYRAILKLQPKNAVTLSDLATVLAEQPNDESRKEALDCVERAIELVGPQPALLDTKGMALFYDGKPERAEIALQAAAQSPNPDPRYCFHYAVVCADLGNLDRARTALKQARDGDLEHQLLTTKDRQLLTKLEKQVAQ